VTEHGARPWALILATTVACGRSCGLEDTKTYETLKGPIKVSLVRTMHWSEILPVGDFHLHVETTPPFDESVACESVDLAENEPPTIVAFRCKDKGASAAWQMIRIDTAGRHVLDCSADLGTGAKPDYAKARPVVDAAPDILACHLAKNGLSEFTIGQVLTVLADITRGADGWKGARTLLAHTSDVDILDSTMPDDYWVTHVLALALPERKDVETDLCPVLATPRDHDHAYVRAARLCPLEGATIADAATTRMSDALAAPLVPRRTRRDSVVEWATYLATHNDAKRAADAACSFASSATAGDWRLGLAFTAIAGAKATCHDAVARFLDGACSAQMDCGDGTWGSSRLCTRADIKPDLDEWLASGKMTGSVRQAGPRFLAKDLALLAAAYGSEKTLPRGFALRNARRHYSAPTTGTPCTDRLARGAACDCAIDDEVRCNLPLDGGRIVQGPCAIRASDHDSEVSATHVCSVVREPCSGDDDCCAGLQCSDSGRCEKP
jgi:hypothetical protein